MKTDSQQQLADGAKVLGQLLKPFGFKFHEDSHGDDADGAFAKGSFTNGERVLALCVQSGLGPVTYRIGDAELSHETFMRFADHWHHRQYPHAGQTTQESFVALGQDLARYFGDFVGGDGELFKTWSREWAADPKRFHGLAGLGRK
ncbi:hypothetical protein BH10PSE17_BH10PSE17_26530 [soil metagenome]